MSVKSVAAHHHRSVCAIHSVCAVRLLVVVLTTIILSFQIRASEFDRAMKRADAIEIDFRQSGGELTGHTLKDYLIYAALNNPDLRASFFNWKSKLEGVSVASSLPDPVFSYGYFIENVETRVGPQDHRFKLTQTFPWFGTLGTKGDIAFEAANVEFQRFQKEKLMLFYRVKSAYYEYYLLGRELEITRANIELLKYWESVARSRYKAALMKHQDIMRVQVELGRLEDRLSSLEERRAPVVARLRELLNLEGPVDLPVPDTIDEYDTPVDAESLKSMILENNPDMKMVGHLVGKEEAAVKLARKASYPNFMIGIDYINTGEAIDPTMSESGKDPWIFNAGISIPLWFGKNKAMKEQARARLEMARFNLKSRENGLLAQADRVIFEYRDAVRKTDLYRDGLIPKAEQLLNSAYTAYQTGESDFLNVIDAQRQLIDLQLQSEQALTVKATKLAEIEMLTGKEM